MISTITKENISSQSKVGSGEKIMSTTKTAVRTYRVFIVDDDPMVLKLLKRYFSDFSQYEITNFSNGEDCLKALVQNPDMIILDYNLSENSDSKNQMDGLDVLKEIKNHDPNIQVMMLSAQVQVQVAVDCLKKGAVNYIVKDGVMQFNIKEALDAIVKSQQLKEEIQLLSNTIKRDKLLIRGYGALTIILVMVLFYFWRV